MNLGLFLPGSTINMGELSEQLGISKTPLRDALILLEAEGFVTILPRRGVKVNTLTLLDIKNSYNAIGIIESSIIMDFFDRLNPSHFLRFEELNEKMISDINKEDFKDLFKTNLKFHDIYIDLSDNTFLKKFMIPIKQRLYDFPRQNFIKEWELQNCREHAQLIKFLKQGNLKKAAEILRQKHWSFEYQKSFIEQFHNMEIRN
jgi:DNA-binding GntR family transcriptional regulator